MCGPSSRRVHEVNQILPFVFLVTYKVLKVSPFSVHLCTPQRSSQVVYMGKHLMFVNLKDSLKVQSGEKIYY